MRVVIVERSGDPPWIHAETVHIAVGGTRESERRYIGFFQHACITCPCTIVLTPNGKKWIQLVKYWKSVTGRGSTANISMAFNGFCPGIHTRYAAAATTTLPVFQFYLQNAPTFRWSVILLAHWSEEFSLLISIPTTYKNVLGHKSTDQAVMYSCSFFLFSW